MDNLSDTERLIVSYVRSHTPEDCMLDKISTGTGKSRATVLKYLESLYVKSILDFKIIGRSKLWMLKKVPEPTKTAIQEKVVGQLPPEIGRIAASAQELFNLKAREKKLTIELDTPDIIVFLVDPEMRLILANRTFESRFPGARDVTSLLRPEDVASLTMAMSEVRSRGIESTEADLAETAGIYRTYHLTMMPVYQDKRSSAIIVIGEDHTAIKRSKQDLESILYIIRTAGEARTESWLLEGTMQGIKARLLPYMHGAVILNGGFIAYQSPGMPHETLRSCRQLIERSMASLETVSMISNDAHPTGEKGTCHIAVPIISDERSYGAILLVIGSPVSSSDIENVEIVADEVSTVLKTLRLDREKSEYANSLLAVNKVSAVLNETWDETAMLERSITSTMEALGFDMGCVYLKDQNSDNMALRVQKNMPESLRNMCISSKFKGLFNRAFQERRVIYITRESPEYAELDPEIRENEVRTILMLPIKSGDEVAGILNMGSRSDKPYSQMSLENVATVGLQLGIALERSRLATELRERDNKDVT
ncbi:MAG TPA: GAF domain-containing protein [Methanocella sp.]|nr:GAF domain-containing protein [Methanocella sp.]